MSILFTGDIQAEFGTLDLCEKAWNEILNICKKERIKTIVNLGDLKNSYNPVDLRIVAWWQQSLIRATKRGISVILLLGNHDRVGAYSNAGNWLETLRKTSGVYVYDKPGTFSVDDIELYLLPFNNTSNTRLGARQCKEMAVKSKAKTKILCFHANLIEARYNKQGSKSHAELSVSDLYSKFYDWCIGGDIHNPQQIGKNTYYVGSPFCTSWGEVNQIKRYIVVGENGLQSIHSRIHGWFDPSVSGFKDAVPKSWAGARIRISVECDASSDYGRKLEHISKKVGRKYRGAEIYVVPKFTNTDRDTEQIISRSDTDERKIRQYIKSEANRRAAEVAVSRLTKYMLKVLSQFEGGLRQSNKVKFISARGINFLPFKKLELTFKKGITLVQAINEDRNKKSNGGGKTSSMQLIPVSFFGRTFKEQKSDAWANRWKPKEPAFAEVVVESGGKEIKIIRGRRPPQLRMYVNGKEVSSGMRTTDREGTQSQIEKVTGFTWQTLANAVYIDRTVADAFLSGTNKQRTDVLSRFQNLERFERALGTVKEDIKANELSYARTKEKLLGCRSSIEHVEHSIKDLVKVSSSQLKSIGKQWKKAEYELEKHRNDKCKSYQEGVLKAGYALQEYEKRKKECEKISKKMSLSEAKRDEIENKCRKVTNISYKRECPTCRQQVNKSWVVKYIKKLKLRMKEVSKEHSKSVKLYNNIKKQRDSAEDQHGNYQNKIAEIKDKERSLETEAKQLQRQYDGLQRKQQESTPVSEAKRRLKKLKRRKEELKVKLERYERRNKVYKYAAEAFSRDGIPAFLNRQLCPTLNKAAVYYAELFSDSEVQVQFTVEGGEFVPKIINANGGAEIGDQSEGEKALAGLISSFALREAAPETNLLILDEPGAGLDDITARQFARSLRKLVKRFKCIYVVTHNKAISSELENERIITIRKRHKISRVEAA